MMYFNIILSVGITAYALLKNKPKFLLAWFCLNLATDAFHFRGFVNMTSLKMMGLTCLPCFSPFILLRFRFTGLSIVYL